MKKILIVDDEQSTLLGLSKAMYKCCDFDGEVKTVENGKDAIHEISHCQYDICFLDLILPDIHGLDVLKKINEISPGTKVAVMSASIITDEMEMKIKDGASVFFPKPLNLNEIKVFLQKALKEISDVNGSQKALLKGDIRKKRRVERQHVINPINCSISILDYKGPDQVDIKGIITSISDTGLGFYTDHYLEPGHMLRFNIGGKQKEGIVKWSMMIERHYSVGIKFL